MTYVSLLLLCVAALSHVLLSIYGLSSVVFVWGLFPDTALGLDERLKTACSIISSAALKLLTHKILGQESLHTQTHKYKHTLKQWYMRQSAVEVYLATVLDYVTQTEQQ